jgi:urea carboxylase
VDPRHRLVTTKYNPARTWTPENAVGIGGAYLCVYGMEGPGGYQFVGRTVQMWNAWKQTRDFERPYLLRFFDRIRFHEVSAEELLELREEFPRGRYTLRVEHGVFSLGDHHRFLASIAAENATWLAHRNRAFEEERRHWASLPVADSGGDGWMEPAEVTLPEGCDAVRSPVTASVWNVSVESGQRVEAGQRLMVVEAMKMEVAVVAPSAGEVVEVLCKPGNMVVAGQPLALLRTDARV